MLFEPRFKATGMLALPYYFMFELFAPLIKVVAIIYIIYSVSAGHYNTQFILLLFTGVLLLNAVFSSTIMVLIENWSLHQAGSSRDALRYKRTREWMILVGISIVSDCLYGFFKTAAQIKGMVDFIRKKSEWNKFERKGIIKI